MGPTRFRRARRLNVELLGTTMLTTFLAFLVHAIGLPAVTQHTGILTRDGGVPACWAREVARHRLVVEGDRELYVEPSVLVSSGGKVLLAGQPTYIFSPQRRSGAAAVEGHGTVFGAAITSDGRARTVPHPPIPGKVAAAIAAIDRGEGGWRVIFAEFDSVPTTNTRPRQFWYGVYDGSRWSSVEPLPNPPGTALLYLNHSSLIQRGDTLLWAAQFEITPTKSGVAVYERTNSRWSYDLLPAPSATYVALAHSPLLGDVVAVVHPDTSLRRDRGSVFFYGRRQGWTRLHKVVAGTDEDVHHPSLRLAGNRWSLTWRSFGSGLVQLRPAGVPQPDDSSAATGAWASELRAMTGLIGTGNEPVAVIDRAVGEGWEALETPQGLPIWVVDHVLSGGLGKIPVRELRMIRRSDDSTDVFWRTPHPYRGPFAAIGLRNSEVLVAGPKLEEAREVLVSLLIRVRVECDAPPYQRRESPD